MDRGVQFKLVLPRQKPRTRCIRELFGYYLCLLKDAVLTIVFGKQTGNEQYLDTVMIGADLLNTHGLIEHQDRIIDLKKRDEQKEWCPKNNTGVRNIGTIKRQAIDQLLITVGCNHPKHNVNVLDRVVVFRITN